MAAISVYGACNQQVIDSCYTGSSNTCSAATFACQQQAYPGTVTDAGLHFGVTSASSSGWSSKTPGDVCTYVCTITSNCHDESPEVDVQGDNEEFPSGSTCSNG